MRWRFDSLNLSISTDWFSSPGNSLTKLFIFFVGTADFTENILWRFRFWHERNVVQDESLGWWTATKALALRPARQDASRLRCSVFQNLRGERDLGHVPLRRTRCSSTTSDYRLGLCKLIWEGTASVASFPGRGGFQDELRTLKCSNVLTIGFRVDMLCFPNVDCRWWLTVQGRWRSREKCVESLPVSRTTINVNVCDYREMWMFFSTCAGF